MSTRQTLTDTHTACLNRLYGVFHSEACRGLSLQEKGYNGFLDPKYRSNKREFETDFLGVGTNDVQHFKVVGAKPIVDDNLGVIVNEGEIENQLEKLNGYKQITPEMAEEFLSVKNYPLRPTIQERVALLPTEAYKRNKNLIDNFCREKDIVVWTVSLKGTEKVEKVAGKHKIPEIDELISDRGTQDGVHLQDIDSSIFPVTRGSDLRLIKFTFASRLVKFSYLEQTIIIPYEKIDEIMTDRRRPILGHLSKTERDSVWQQCMLTLRNTLKLIKDSQKGVNVFEWKKERFLYDKSARASIIEEIRSGLGIGEEA